MTIKKDRIVCVDWEDSFHDNDWMHRSHARHAVGISKCRTVGYLLKSNFKEVTLFMSKSDTGNITDTMTIPRKCVKKMRYLQDD